MTFKEEMSSAALTFESNMTDAILRIKSKQKAIKNMEYELQLLKDDIVNIANRRPNDIIVSYIPLAKKWLDMKNKVDKRKNCTEKTAYKFLCEKLSEYIGLPISNINKIWQIGMQSPCGYNIDLDGHYTLEIPVYGNLTYDYVYMFNGAKYRLLESKAGNSCLYAVWECYNLQDIKKYFTEKENNVKHET